MIAGLPLGIAWLAAACGDPGADAPARPPRITSTETLIANFQAQATSIEIVRTIPPAFFLVSGTEIRLEGARVEIFEFPDPAAAVTAADSIAYDGSAVGGVPLDLDGRPHFFKVDRLIVFYVGDDASILERLYGVFGPQLAGQ